MTPADAVEVRTHRRYPELYGKVAFGFGQSFGIAPAAAAAVNLAQLVLNEAGVPVAQQLMRSGERVGEFEFWPILRLAAGPKRPAQTRFVVGALVEPGAVWQIPPRTELEPDGVTQVWLFLVEPAACLYHHWVVPIATVVGDTIPSIVAAWVPEDLRMQAKTPNRT